MNIWERFKRRLDYKILDFGESKVKIDLSDEAWEYPPDTFVFEPENLDVIFADGSPVVEAMAEEVHEIWCEWMKYMFKSGYTIWERSGMEGMSDISYWAMNRDKYRRWQRQMKTRYANLTEEEKQSDRDIAKRYLRLLFDPEGRSVGL